MASFFYPNPLETESFWLVAVVSLANSIIWRILTRIVIGLFCVLYQRQEYADDTFIRMDNKSGFKIQPNV